MRIFLTLKVANSQVWQKMGFFWSWLVSAGLESQPDLCVVSVCGVSGLTQRDLQLSALCLAEGTAGMLQGVGLPFPACGIAADKGQGSYSKPHTVF